MSNKEALEILRTKYKTNFVKLSFMYKNLWVFSVSMDEKNVEGDLATFFVSVNADTGEMKIFEYYKEMFDDYEEFSKATNNMIMY